MLRHWTTNLIGFVLAMSLAGCGEAQPHPAGEQPDPVRIRWHGRETGYEGETKKYEDGRIENTSVRERP